MTKVEAVADDRRPELVFALVGAIGTSLSEVQRMLVSALDAYGYPSSIVRLSSILGQLQGLETEVVEKPRYDRIKSCMKAGTELRERIGKGDALVSLGVVAIRALRYDAVPGLLTAGLGRGNGVDAVNVRARRDQPDEGARHLVAVFHKQNPRSRARRTALVRHRPRHPTRYALRCLMVSLSSRI
jgi:hypothetical protein